MPTKISDENAAMVAWVRDMLRQERERTTLRRLGKELGVTHAYLQNLLHNDKRKSLGKKISLAIASRYFEGSLAAFRREALKKYSDGNHVLPSDVLPPPQAIGRVGKKPTYYPATRAALKAAIEILVDVRGLKKELVLLAARYTFFSTAEDAAHPFKVANTLHFALKEPKEPAAASRAKGKAPDRDPTGTPSG